MGAIFGLVNTSPTLAEPSLKAMAEALALIPADCADHWVQGSVGLGVRGRAFAKTLDIDEFLFEASYQEGGFVVVSDARLDNRAELLSKLALTDTARQTGTAELLLLAYLKWGESCCEYLLGDFTFAVWDIRRESLFLARDQLGIKPLFLYRGKDFFGFSSDVEGLLVIGQTGPSVCRDAVAHYLGQGELYSDTLTFFNGIEKLPPATWLRLSMRGEKTRRYWNPAAQQANKDIDFDTAVQSLHSLLQDAVSKRVTARGPVAAHLSGGLDSSAIVALAAGERDDKKCRLTTWSWMRSPCSPQERQDSEWRLANVVAVHCDVEHHFTDFASGELQRVLQDEALLANDSTDLWYEYSARSKAANTGTRTVLCGWGGDQFISHFGIYTHAQAFWRGGEYRATLRRLYQQSLSAAPGRRWRRMLGKCYRHLLLPLWPLHSRAVSRVLRTNYLRFATADTVACAVSAGVDRKRFYRGFTSRGMQLSELHDGHLLNRIESWAVLGNRQGLDYSYPLLDRRIVEFALGLPAHFYFCDGISRRIFREAIKSILPEEVWAQGLQTEPNRVAETPELLGPVINELLKAVANYSSEFVDIPALEAAFTELRDRDSHDVQQVRIPGETILKSLLVVQLEARFGVQSD